MSTRRKVMLAVAMTFVILFMVGASAVAGYLALQQWEEGQWEMAGIFAVGAAIFLASTFVLAYQMRVALGKQKRQLQV